MVPRHLPGPRIQRCCHISPCQRGSPPSPALPPHLLLGKPHRCRQHQFWPGAPSYTALAPSPSPGDRSAPPGSRPAERIYLHISTFVPCQRPISALGETKGLGGARAPAPTQLRRPQVPELVRTAARAQRIAAPGPGPVPHPRPRCCPSWARPQRQGQSGCPGTFAGVEFTCSCRQPQVPRWFAGASRVPRTACAPSTCFTP